MDAREIREIRTLFPILETRIEGRPLVYLDNTATSQTPTGVVDEVVAGYEKYKANVHRGVHTLSQLATDRQEEVRRKVARFIGASSHEEVIFTSGTTDSINIVSASYGELIPEGSEIILSVMEHHSNIVPWQLLAERRGLSIKVVDIDAEGRLDMDGYIRAFSDKTAFVSLCHVSNVLGTINPVSEIVDIAHSHGVPVHLDGAQASPHIKLDMRALGCDFYSFSSHKMYGPTGVGILYGRRELLEKMPPCRGGGEMIKHVSFSGTTFADLPFKFEAGTPDFVGIAAFGAAIDFIEKIGLERIEAHEEKLLDLATAGLRDIEGVEIYGTAPHKSAVLSFNYREVHPYDVGLLLDKMGVAVRTGHHCAQPLMERLGIPGTVRASFAVYNTEEEVEDFLTALRKVISFF